MSRFSKRNSSYAGLLKWWPGMHHTRVIFHSLQPAVLWKLQEKVQQIFKYTSLVDFSLSSYCLLINKPIHQHIKNLVNKLKVSHGPHEGISTNNILNYITDERQLACEQSGCFTWVSAASMLVQANNVTVWKPCQSWIYDRNFSMEPV